MKTNLTKIFGFSAIIIGLALIGSGLWLLLSPAQYQAAVRVRIGQAIPGDYDPYFIQTEFEIIKSSLVFSNVVEKLNLCSDWNGNTKLKFNEAVHRLQHQTTVQAGPVFSYILEIHVTDKEPLEAANLANVIAESYCHYRIERLRRDMIAGIEVLKGEYQKAENDKDRQEFLNMLRKELDFTNSEPAEVVLKSSYPAHFQALRELESSISIIDPAVPPTAPIGPNRLLGLILLLCGLTTSALGFYLIFRGRTVTNSKP
jgi:uncharacterized protein involved in exopolysaccharide biosynthesis